MAISRWSDTDLDLSTEGDLVLDEGGDLKLVSGLECLLDDIRIAVKTNKGDVDPSVPYPEANLITLAGMSNVASTGVLGATLIRRAIINSGILKQSEFTVLPIPSGDTIRYYITVVSDPNNVVVEYHTDLSTGLGRFGV